MNKKQNLIEYLATHNKNYTKTQYYKILELKDLIKHEKTNNYYTLAYIFIQELYENDLLNIEELKKKYSLNEKEINTLENIFNEIYGDEDGEQGGQNEQ